MRFGPLTFQGRGSAPPAAQIISGVAELGANSESARYFARLHTTSLLVPVVVAGLVYLSSSAVSEVMIRF
jgi:hypothetical protein